MSQDQMTAPYAEYLRRNLVVAGSIGASAGCRTILERLASQKRPPQWLIKQVASIKDRVDRSTPELCNWRAAAPGVPVYMLGKETNDGK